MAPTISEWRIHVGAHKTATTHLQAQLWSLRFDLRRAGMVYVPCGQVRPVFRDAGTWELTRWVVGHGRAGRRLDTQLASLAEAEVSSLGGDGAGLDDLHAATSDENILGTALDALRRRPYPSFGRRLGALATLGETRPTTLFLSVRRWDRVLAGAYATALHYRTHSSWLVRLRDRILDRPPPRWTDVLARIARAAPGVPIRVWRQEDYAADRRAILSAFLGQEMHHLPEPPAHLTLATMTPSADAIAEVERLVRAGANLRHGEAWRERVRSIYAERPALGGTRFHPFSPTAVARYADAYATDVEAIRRDWPGCLIEP